MNFKGFLESLLIMGKGMLSIFAVMLVIYGMIVLLNRVTSKKEKKKDSPVA